MLRIKNRGFTLIELMVVIVIIGVLASLAIPRFTEASAKAKVAEAPRVLASYESAFLAQIAETGKGPEVATDLIFEIPTDSRWFTYAVTANSANLNNNAAEAKAMNNIGKFTIGGTLVTTYQSADAANNIGDKFIHSADPALQTVAKRMVPNFLQ